MNAQDIAAIICIVAALMIGAGLGALRASYWKSLYNSKAIEADQWRQSVDGFLTVDQHKRAKAMGALNKVEDSLNAARVVLGLPTPGPRFYAPDNEAAVHQSQMQAYSDAWSAGQIPH